MPKGTPLTKFAPICSIGDCGRPVKGHGMCRPHLRAWVSEHGPFPIVTYPDKCTIEGCGRDHKGKGYCGSHLRKFNLYGDPLAPRPRKNPSPFCVVDDCDRPVNGHGYCFKHLYRWKKYGDPLKLAEEWSGSQKGKTCESDDCDRPAFSKYLCKYHYHRTYSVPKLYEQRMASYEGLPPEAFMRDGRRKAAMPSLDERIEAAIARMDENGPYPTWRPDLGRCLLWTGCVTTGGHAQLVMGSGDTAKRYQLHRLMWERINGPIPEGLVVDHLCRVAACQRADTHFELVTAGENSRRRMECARCLFFRDCPECGMDLRECGRVAPPPPQLKLGRRDSLTMEERFNIFTVDGPISPFTGTPCLDWVGSRNELDYGYMPNKGTGSRKMSAHRFGYELVNGPIPEGLTIDHLCRRPWCVRGNGHLEAVTQSENSHRRHDCTRCRLLRECPSCHLDIASVTSADRWRVAA